MKAWLRNTASPLADRKGVTTVEYATIAAGIFAVVVSSCDALFARAGELLRTVAFP